MIVSISFSKASDHFVEANNMIKIGSNYGEFATFKPVDFDGFKPLEFDGIKPDLTVRTQP